MDKAKWYVFNQGEELEFAECSACGYEQEPCAVFEDGYPGNCPGCGREITGKVRAEDVPEEDEEPK